MFFSGHNVKASAKCTTMCSDYVINSTDSSNDNSRPSTVIPVNFEVESNGVESYLEYRKTCSSPQVNAVGSQL